MKMNIVKQSKITLTLTAWSFLLTNIVLAEKIDVSKSNRDIMVMSKIMETSLESSAEAFPGKPHIEGVFLAKQGYLFNIRFNGIGGFHVPGIASWDSGRLELNIPEIITEALAGIDYGEAFDPDVNEEFVEAVEPVIESLDSVYEDEALRAKLREIREHQREVRHETYQLRRDIRKLESDEDKKRKQLEDKLDDQRSQLKQQSEKYSELLNSYKNERQQRSIDKSNKAVAAVFATLCDYGQSFKALGKNEKITLMIKGGVDDSGKKATQVYVIEQNLVKNCKDSKKLKSKALYYNL